MERLKGLLKGRKFWDGERGVGGGEGGGRGGWGDGYLAKEKDGERGGPGGAAKPNRLLSYDNFIKAKKGPL